MRPRLALAAVLCLAALAGSVAVPGRAGRGVQPVALTLLGGGAIGPSFDPDHRDVGFTTIRVSEDGLTVHVWSDWPARCTGLRRPVTLSFFTPAPVGPDGSFTVTAPIPSTVAVGTFTLAGEFRDEATAGGTLTATFDYALPGRTVPCTVSRTWEVRAPVAGGPPKLLPATAYYGVTSQTLPFVLRTSPARAGKRVAQAAMLWTAQCTPSGTTAGGPVYSPGIGVFASTRFSFASVRVATQPGRIVTTTSTFRGQFATGSAAGTWVVVRSLRHRPDNALADQCQTGPVAWTAVP